MARAEERFTADEDATLWRLREAGMHFGGIASRMEGRSIAALQQRYNRLVANLRRQVAAEREAFNAPPAPAATIGDDIIRNRSDAQQSSDALVRACWRHFNGIAAVRRVDPALVMLEANYGAERAAAIWARRAA